MKRKDYRLIAKVFASSFEFLKNPSLEQAKFEGAKDHYRFIKSEFIKELKIDNPNFSEEKFERELSQSIKGN